MCEFTKKIVEDSAGSSVALQVSRSEESEVRVNIYKEGNFSVNLDKANTAYSADELLEILQLIVPFCIASTKKLG
jgi:archaellum component FlaF (FlaF/FlaG flagellin family)